MNKPLFWKLGLSAILALGLSACSSSSSSAADDDDDIGYSFTEKDSGKSSSSQKSSSCKSVTASLAVPTNLEVVKNGDDKWVLIWDYSANDERPETGFVIESLDMSDSVPNWKTVGTTNEAVVMYNLSGESKAGKYYRVSAMDDCGVSKATDMVEVTKTGANSTTSADLAVPTNLKLENIGDNMWQLSWSYTNNENRPEQGFKLQSLNLNDKSPKWADDGSANKGVHVVKIDGNKKGGLLFHVAAKDDKGVSEYSEEITIPRVVDSTSSSSDIDMDLAIPTGLKLDSIGANKYQLSWSYTDNKNRPENGFKIQSLNVTAEKPAWAVIDSTNKGVNRIIIDAKKWGGNYLRVAAKDSKGTSTYSSEIQVPKADTTKVEGQEINLAVPFDLTLKELGNNEYLLSWNYTNNEKRPENGFKLQSLDFKAASPKWTDEGTTNKGVHVYKIDATKKGGLIIHVAAKDDKGFSEYSAEITIPSISDSAGSNTSVDLSVPTDLKADSVGVNKYQLSWSYTDNKNRPENGFKLQILDLSAANPSWIVLDSTNKGVRLYNVDATKHGGKFVRVAAKDAKGISEYSYEIKIPAPDTTKVEGQEIDLAVPVNLTLNSLGNNEYLLSWSYTDADKRPAKEFVMQKLYLANGKSWENVKATINKDVLFYKIEADTCDYFIRIAAKDDKGLSAYSNVVQVPKKGAGADIKNPPTNLAISRIAPSVWELSWNYENNVENANRKFIIQSSKLKDFKWVDIGQKLDGNVRNYYIQGHDKIETYYRMAVINDGDTSAFTEAIQLTPEIPYRDYMALNVPEMTSRFTMVFTTLFEADQDTSTKEDRTFTEGVATYTIMNNLISKYIFESEYTKDVHYEARWFTSLEKFNYYKGTCDGMKKSDKCDSCFWEESFPYEEPSISKRISWGDASDEKLSKNIYDSCATETGYEKANHFKLYDPNTDPDEWATIMNAEYDMHFCVQDYARKICEYYVQLRIVWTDINDETDWSEWSKPFNVREINGAKAFCEDN